MKVSVVVPVYGVEKYIERCARSLFEQTLDSIEYIFVDDCSPDRSVEILERVLEEYPHRKGQVRIIHHEENKGLPTARRSGIMVAKGDYITHCDSDDWIDKDMYRAMWERASFEGLDMVTCDSWFASDRVDHISGSDSSFYSSDKELFMYNIIDNKFNCAVWLSLVRRGVYEDNDIVYPTANNAEDYALTVQLIYYAKSYGRIETTYYYYFINPDSITRMDNETSIVNRCIQYRSNVDLVVSFLKDKGLYKRYEPALRTVKFRSKSYLVPLLKVDTKYLGLWREVYPELNYKYYFDPRPSLNMKILFLLVYLGVYTNVICRFKDWVKGRRS